MLDRSLRRFLAGPTVLTFALLVAGCASAADSGEYEDDAGGIETAAAPAADQPPITAAEVAGHWTSSEYGDLYFMVKGSEVRVVYGNDGGRMIGSWQGATLAGWWSELPTRKPGDDAGEVQLTFLRRNGTVTAEGWWRPGTDNEYETDWTMNRVDKTIPAAISPSFAQSSQFIRHP
jgi:hypothetical protein